jgi:hypothetical protein
MINVGAIIYLALITNPQFNKMVLKTSGSPLHSTHAKPPTKKTKSFKKLYKSYKQFSEPGSSVGIATD